MDVHALLIASKIFFNGKKKSLGLKNFMQNYSAKLAQEQCNTLLFTYILDVKGSMD